MTTSTERPFVPLPTFDAESPFGPVYIVTRGGDSAYEREPGEPRPTRTAAAMTHGSGPDRPHAGSVTINGVDYSLRVEVADYGDGWTLAKDRSGHDWHAISGTRDQWTNYNDSHLSAAAQRKVREVLLPWLVGWLSANPEAVAEGERASREQALGSLERKIAEKRDELAGLEARHAAISRGEAE